MRSFPNSLRPFAKPRADPIGAPADPSLNATVRSGDGRPHPHERRTIAGLAGIYLLRLLGMYMVLPVLALHAAKLEGSTPVLVGLAVGGYGLAQAALQIPFGVWSDRYGRRRVIAGGLLVFALGSVLAAVADGAWLLVIGRVLQGAGGISAAVVALIADVSRPQVRAQAMAVLGAAVGVAFAIGMIAGPGLAGRFGVPFLFWLTAGLTMLAVLYVAVGIPGPNRHVHDATLEWTPGHLAEVLRSTAMRRLDLGALLLHSSVTALFVVGPVLLQRHLPASEHGTVYGVLVPIGLVLMVISAFFADRHGRLKDAILSGGVCLLGAAVCLAFGRDSFPGVVGAMGLTIAAVAIAEPAAPAMVTRLANDQARGTAAGVYHLCQFTGSFIGGLVGGLLLEDPQTLGVALIVGAILWLLLASNLPRLKPGRLLSTPGEV